MVVRVVVAILVIASGVSYFLLTGRAPARSAPTAGPAVAREVVPAPRAPAAQPLVARREFSAGCRNLWDKLAGMNLSELALSQQEKDGDPFQFMTKLREVKRETAEAPCKDLTADHPLFERHAAFVTACSADLTEPPLDEAAGDESLKRFMGFLSRANRCRQEIQKYRLKVEIYELERTPIAEIHSADKLMRLAASEVIDEKATPERLSQIAAQILRNDPENRVGADMLVRAKLDEARTRPEAKRELDEAIEKLRAVAPDSNLLSELRFAPLVETKSADAVAKLAAAEAMAHPRSDVGPYYSAWAAHLRGDQATAIRMLSDLVRANPGNSRATYTLNVLSGKAPADHGAFVNESEITVSRDLLTSYF